MRVSPNPAPSIVVIGSLNRDLVVTAPKLPLPGETIHGIDYSQHNGGKGANQAVALARLGQRVSMVGCVGNDADGSALISALEDDSVNTDWISRTSSLTGVAIITIDANGENSIVVVSGANGDLDESAIDAAAPAIAAADIVLAQLEVPISTVARAFRHATGTVVLNPAPASRVDAHFLRPVDYLVPNRTELATLSERDIPENDDEILACVGALEFDGVVIVTLGSDGAIAVRDGSIVGKSAPPHVDVIDTVGAGDAFCAGFCDALARDVRLPEAITWATACGSLATTRSGAQTSMPNTPEVTTLLSGRPLQ
jgi:ribokinase